MKIVYKGFPGSSAGKESTCSAGDTRDLGLIPGLGRSPEAGNGNPPQYSCLKNPMDRGAWQATVHGVAELDMTEQRSMHASCVPGTAHWLICATHLITNQDLVTAISDVELKSLATC